MSFDNNKDSRNTTLREVGRQIFLSYASEDRELADQVHLALTAGGFQVFFDKDSLPPGGDFHTRIRNAVESSDVFVFLISPNSVATGSYALTELKYARAKWSHPKGRVLPVRLQKVDWENIPAFLKAVTVLEPEGSVPAEVLAALLTMTGLVSKGKVAARASPAGRHNSDKKLHPAIEKTHKITVPLIVATMGLAGVLGAAVISNWDKLFPTQTGIEGPVADIVHVCEGADRDNTVALIYATLDTSFKCGTNPEQCDIAGLGTLTERLNQLPRPCQALLNDVSGQFSATYGDGGQQCKAGVCCDSTGCY